MVESPSNLVNIFIERSKTYDNGHSAYRIVGCDRVIERAISREWQVYFTRWRQRSITAELYIRLSRPTSYFVSIVHWSYVHDFVRSRGGVSPPDGRSCGFVACGR